MGETQSGCWICAVNAQLKFQVASCSSVALIAKSNKILIILVLITGCRLLFFATYRMLCKKHILYPAIYNTLPRAFVDLLNSILLFRAFLSTPMSVFLVFAYAHDSVAITSFASTERTNGVIICVAVTTDSHIALTADPFTDRFLLDSTYG